MSTARICFPPLCARRERPNITPSRSVCRQLFGPVNHEQLRADLQREKVKLNDENCQRWNFDFNTGTPLVGKYRWQKVQCNVPSSTPRSSLPDCESVTEPSQRSFFSNCNSSSSSTTIATTTTTSQRVTISNDPNTAETGKVLLESEKRAPEKISKGIRKRKSTGKITDFLRTKKQRTVEKRPRIGPRKQRSKQTCMDKFVRKQ